MERSPESLELEEEFLAKLRAARALKTREREVAEQVAQDHQAVEIEREQADTSSQTPVELRAKFISDSMRRGVEMGDIAQALNMKKAAVEKLAGQLLGQVLPEPSLPKAVNE